MHKLYHHEKLYLFSKIWWWVTELEEHVIKHQEKTTVDKRRNGHSLSVGGKESKNEGVKSIMILQFSQFCLSSSDDSIGTLGEEEGSCLEGKGVPYKQHQLQMNHVQIYTQSPQRSKMTLTISRTSLQGNGVENEMTKSILVFFPTLLRKWCGNKSLPSSGSSSEQALSSSE